MLTCAHMCLDGSGCLGSGIGVAFVDLSGRGTHPAQRLHGMLERRPELKATTLQLRVEGMHARGQRGGRL